jgi:hypothetical protein
MSIITTTEATNFVGATVTEELIADAEALLVGLLDVDSLEQDTYDVVAMVKGRKVIARNFPITSIEELGGEAYTGEEPTDYQIRQNIVSFTDPTALSAAVCRRIKFKYIAGYTSGNMPNGIKLLVKYIASGLYNTKENVGTVSCKIGQEAFQFASVSDMTDFKRLLAKYRKVFISVI